jgi:serine/threonine-protein kinase
MTITNYSIKQPIGQGGMATVYLAQDNKFDTQVAIKVLNKELSHNENIRKRFLAEAKNMFKMSHPNIIKVTDLIDDGDTVAFVMEYIDGETLKEYIDRKGRLSDEEIKTIFSQMLDSVGYVHEQNLVHRDIKPSNFMITPKGQIKLLDFGIAKNTDTNSADYTQTGTTQNMGTPMYMSPEQIKSTKDVTLQSDIYSLGVVLWQMVTGTKPYNTATTSTFDLQTKIVTEKLTITNSQFDSIIEVATAKETNFRYSNCLEFKKNLESPSLKSNLSSDDKTVVLNDDKTVVSNKMEKTIYESKEEKINHNNEINSKFSPIPRISFFGSYAYAIKNYANFKGRTNRRVYWNFTLISCLISLIPIIGFVHYLFILIPSISIAVRRMHDVGKSGWFVLIPIYGFILSVIKGNPYKNEYGENIQ